MRSPKAPPARSAEDTDPAPADGRIHRIVSVSPGKSPSSIPCRSAAVGTGIPVSFPGSGEIPGIRRNKTSDCARRRSPVSDRAAVGESKLLRTKWRNASPSGRIFVVEIVARIKRSIAQKLKHASMNLIDSRFRDHIRKTRAPCPNSAGIRSRTRNFLNRIHVKVGSVAPPISGSVVSTPSTANTVVAPRSIHRKLLRKIRGAVGIGPWFLPPATAIC